MLHLSIFLRNITAGNTIAIGYASYGLLKNLRWLHTSNIYFKINKQSATLKVFKFNIF